MATRLYLLAAQCGSLETVQALLGAGASVTAKNSFGETAFMIATRLGYTGMAQLLKTSLPLFDRIRIWLKLKSVMRRKDM